ncbi:MAG: GNAT family N-acetyltransferase [Promethearchaeota archaeon]
MSQITIRVMTHADIDFGYHLASDVENWGYTKEDFKRLLHYEPDGCFVAEKHAQRIGIVTTTTYGIIAHLGTLIVIPSYRNKGIGAALTEHAIEYLENRGIETIKLDAVTKAIPLYERLGFQESFQSLRFIGSGRKTEIKGILGMNSSDLSDVITLDHQFSGLQRERVLQHIFNDFPHLCFVSRKNSQLLGYIMAKKSIKMYKIGPWICNPDYEEIAGKLLRTVMNKANYNLIWVGLPGVNKNAVSVMKNNGFVQKSSSIRMERGKAHLSEDVRGIYGIGSPEKG